MQRDLSLRETHPSCRPVAVFHFWFISPAPAKGSIYIADAIRSDIRTGVEVTLDNKSVTGSRYKQKSYDGTVCGGYATTGNERWDLMAQLFKSAFHDEFGTWPFAYSPYGGADFGEIARIAEIIDEGNDDVYYDTWYAAAERIEAEAESTLSKCHPASARALFLRASAFYATSYHPIYGEPVDPRLLRAFQKQVALFDRGMDLSAPAVLPLRIPFEATTMPAYVIPAVGKEQEVRPLLILTNGYDGTITDMYFATAVAASQRGYHCLLFDGPGQGEMLYEHGVRLRPDWETVVKAVVDFALTLPHIDPTRIALSGWSLGGYLAPRAASGESRIAALIADPGQWSVAGGFRSFAINLGVPAEEAADLGALDQKWIDKMEQIIQHDRKLRWSVKQRGFWVNGVNNLRDYFASAEQFTMEGRAELIQCPTLITMAEEDRLSASAVSFFEALRCPKDLLRFTSEEGAGVHCEMRNRSLLNRRVLDWLDEKFDTRH